MRPEETRSDLVKEVYSLVDPHGNSNMEKSRTAFLSFQLQNGSIALSAFLARAMGFVAGDRIAFISTKSNPLKWFIVKTNQRSATKEIRISRGVYKVNNLKWIREIGVPFRFNMNYTKLVRLYVNMQTPVKIEGFGQALQIFDLPYLRDDFNTEEEKLEYAKYLEENPYIVKPVEQTVQVENKTKEDLTEDNSYIDK